MLERSCHSASVLMSIHHCQNETTRREIERLYAAGETEELERRMRSSSMHNDAINICVLT